MAHRPRTRHAWRRTLAWRGAALVVVTVVVTALVWWLWPRAARQERPPVVAQRTVAVIRPGQARDTATGSTSLDVPLMSRTSRLGADVFGINEGVGVPPLAIAAKTRTLRTRATLSRRAWQVGQLGASVVRASSHVFPGLNYWQMLGAGAPGGQDGPLPLDAIDWSSADAFFKATGEAGLDVVVVIGPWPGARTSVYTARYVPQDLGPYEAWVSAVVERYDGDGRDDMPGLQRPVLAWEIDNEPDLHNAEPPRDAQGTSARPGTFETPAEYATVLLSTSRAIRAAAPDAFILSAGLYRPMTPKGAAYFERVLAVAGVREAIDGVSLHCYFADDSLEIVHRTMEQARALTGDLPVWITETSVPSGGRGELATPDWQGRMLVGLYGAFIAEGADRVFWHTLVDPPDREGPSGFGSNSLFWEPTAYGSQGAVRSSRIKPSGEAYSRLARRLADAELSDVHEIEASGGRILETPSGWLVFWGAPVPPDGAVTSEDLLTGEVLPVGATVAAPAWLE